MFTNINCKKCSGKIFVDRVYSTHDHLEVFCINCGSRKMYHPPSKFGAFALWLEKIENQQMKKANGR